MTLTKSIEMLKTYNVFIDIHVDKYIEIPGNNFTTIKLYDRHGYEFIFKYNKFIYSFGIGSEPYINKIVGKTCRDRYSINDISMVLKKYNINIITKGDVL